MAGRGTVNMQERATLRDLFNAIDEMRGEMNDGFLRIDDRIRKVETYVAADEASNRAARAFKAGIAKVVTIIVSIIAVAIGAATLILGFVRLALGM